MIVVGQSPFACCGLDPTQTPTPLRGGPQKPPLQIYAADRSFFGSAPIGGLDILTSKRTCDGLCDLLLDLFSWTIN